MTAAIPVLKAASQMQLAPGSTVTIPDVNTVLICTLLYFNVYKN
ncbi:hypothetical protein [Nostoc sp. DSM 114160]